MFPKINASAKATVAHIAAAQQASTVATTGQQQAFVDLAPLINRAVMDSLVRCVFSREYDASLDDERIDVINKLNESWQADLYENIPVVRWLGLNPLRAQSLHYSKRFAQMSTDELNKRRKEIGNSQDHEDDADNADLLSNILGYGTKPTNPGAGAETSDVALTEKEMVDNTSVFFFAGLDTTANSLLFALVALCENPAIMAKAVAEVDDVLEQANDDDESFV